MNFTYERHALPAISIPKRTGPIATPVLCCDEGRGPKPPLEKRTCSVFSHRKRPYVLSERASMAMDAKAIHVTLQPGMNEGVPLDLIEGFRQDKTLGLRKLAMFTHSYALD